MIIFFSRTLIYIQPYFHRKITYSIMELENTTFPLFKPAEGDTLNNYLGLTPTLVSAFALTPEEESSVTLHLFKNSLLLKDQQKNFYSLDLTFQIKLEILYNTYRDVTSMIVGFRLFSEDNKTIDFYGSDSISFSEHLGKILNMKGFQEMFKAVRKLGRGNFATVYESERITDHQRFAVKAFSKQNSYSSKNGRQSLINELSLLRSLNIEPHPNVLRLEAVYQSENSIYVVLELLEGKTLLETIQQRKEPLSDKEIKLIMTGLLKGIGHLIKNRVMHRDIKPENIMIRKQSMEPVIVDFGLSTNVDLPEYLFFRCGTPGYVAPEVIKLTQSVHLEPTCDMFSLGAVFHILLTNKPLFPGTKYDQVYRANKEFYFNFDTQMYQKVPTISINLLEQMLVIQANDRITVDQALTHPFFGRMEEEDIDGKPVSSSSTPSSNSTTNSSGSSKGEKKKKKRFFFF